MDQLSGIDASFLYFETKRTPMHVAGLTLYDMPEGFKGSIYKHFRSFFESRIHLIPIFHRKLARTVFELDHPGWVDAGELDLDYHLQSVKLPKPGSQAQLEKLVAEMHAEPLDRKKPLWQFTIIDGLEKGPNGEKRAAMYSKVHHAAIDGGAGMVITKALYDLGPVPREVEAAEERKATRVPTMAERAILGAHDLMTNAVTQQLKALEAIPKAMEQALDMATKMAKADPRQLADQQLTAPKTPFSITMGKGRSYAARTVPLSKAKEIGKLTGTKLNDVVMATCSGAMHHYLKEKKKLPSTPLVAFVPMSIREAGNTDMNNQVSGMNVPLATQESDPVRRLMEIYKRSSERKDVASSVNPLMPTDYTFIGAPHVLSGLMRLYGDTQLADVIPQAVNVCISNTMGPPIPLYCAGAQVTALYPVSIVTHGVGLNFTVQSYLDGLNFGMTGGRRAVPDIDVLSDMLVAAFDELYDAAKAQAT
ncbi:wax ester/triacylglycerol synthase family O-acyltransferase [Pseudahrensia aquimaris]|uniref:diacylglycerol O-acyltransferase n=1 Tax=Pseudahrensia aquimaris TaxID=744461 RepID=A0ABW3FF80_9HYPH